MKLDREKLFIILLGVFVLLLCIIFARCSSKQRKTIDRLQDNNRALAKDLQVTRLSDSTNKAELETLVVTSDEFKELCSEQADEIKRLGIKVGRLQLANTTATQGNYLVVDTIRDTVVVVNDRVDTLRWISCNDPYYSFNLTFKDNRYSGELVTFDTLTTAVSKEYRKKFLFFHWKPYYKVTIHNRNPHSTITYSEHVEIK